MAKSHDIHPVFQIGDRYGRLTIVEEAEPAMSRGRITSRRVRCVCDCGMGHTVRVNNLKCGGVKSCGCLNRELSRERATKHGGKSNDGTVYAIWRGMVARCENSDHEFYHLYGGRGITVCKAWREDFAVFEAEAGPRPSPSHTVDRIDTNGNYEPGNIRWATMTQQARNRRNNHMVMFEGVEVPMSEAAERSGISPKALAWRIKNGWQSADLFKPMRADSRRA